MRSIASLLVISLVLAVGCGDDDDSTDAAVDADARADSSSEAGDAHRDGDATTDGEIDASDDASDGDADSPDGDADVTPCIDLDGDGYGDGADCLGPDCDDDDIDISPGEPEVCDGVDNDCDDDIDPGCTCTIGSMQPCGTDDGICSVGSETCASDGTWGTCIGNVAPSIPGDDEAAGAVCDGEDDDCDGETDEGCGCVEGATRACGIDEGVCAAGIETCTASGAFAGCTAIEATILIDDEATAGACDGEDDDCDGDTDEGCGCIEGATRACGIDEGVCSAGIETCTDEGVFAGCTATPPAIAAGDEAVALRCNGEDDDCDGTTDEGCGCSFPATRPCGIETGVCAEGTERCTLAGVFAGCNAVGPSITGTNESAELACNGADDDCDGLIDDGCECAVGASRACGTDVGVCVAGTETCTAAGIFLGCSATGAATTATDEASVSLCNGLDDNCDGHDDEGCGCAAGATRACGIDTGVCAAGIETCTLAGVFAGCTATGPTTTATDEASAGLCNGADDNCDGTDDEGCACASGTTQSCGTDIGACEFGIRTCSAGGVFGACVGGVSAGARECNGADNDCNGNIDDFEPPCSTCTAVRLTSNDGNTLRSSIVWNGTELGHAFADNRFGDYEIFFQRLSATGAALSPILRVTTSAGESDAPRLAWNGSSWGLAFYDDRDGNEEIYFARIAADGTEIGDEMRLTTSAAQSSFPTIAWDGGGYGVVYEESSVGTPELDFLRISATGASLTAPMALVSTVARQPDMTWIGTAYALGWSDERHGDAEYYYAQVTTTGVKPLGDVRVTNAGGFTSYPAIAWNGGSELGIAFVDARNRPDGEVFFARIDLSGVLQGTEVGLTANDGGVFSTAIASNGTQYAVVWNDLRGTGLDEIYVAVRGNDGSEVRAPSTITQSADASGYPAITGQGTGFAMTFYDSRAGNNENYLARLGADGLCL